MDNPRNTGPLWRAETLHNLPAKLEIE